MNVRLALERAFRGIEQANQEYLYGIFGNAQWSSKNMLSGHSENGNGRPDGTFSGA
ncbi:hypothetical protein GCM10023187_45940 [Nibrella viscosa]|uniref:Uncharacterized protein n=1 Tax=Nibrella viscosa TaxID=1084524 RepID=A0ABP8KUM6_9BACT